jgi:ATP-dependent DNA ligase
MSLPSRALPAGFIVPCLPTSAPRPPSGELWLHEIKHDGFRVIARKDSDRVRLGGPFSSRSRTGGLRRTAALHGDDSQQP